MSQEFSEVQQAGFAAFLPGPFQQRELFDAVYTALQQAGRLIDDELARAEVARMSSRTPHAAFAPRLREEEHC